jgi:transcriptional regulator with XRE-family HTH domain
MKPGTTINDRLAKVREALGQSPAAFSETIGISRSHLSNIEAGKRGLSIEQVQFLTETLNVAPDYILHGRGPVFRPETKPATEVVQSANQSANLSANQSPSNKTKRTKNEAAVIPMTQARVIVATQDTGRNSTFSFINRKAAANYLTGFESQEYFEHLSAALLPPDLVGYSGRQGIIMEIVGDSMQGKFYDGDYVACLRLEPHEYDQIRDGECFIVVSHSHGIQFKRIKNRLKKYGFIRCKSDNRRHQPFKVYAEDLIELWRFQLHLSPDASNPNETLYGKLDHIEEQNEDLREMYEGLAQRLAEIEDKPRPASNVRLPDRALN